MNKSILSMGLICAAAFTLTNCTKELESQAPVKEGVPFEITASIADTKTTNDGLNTVWAAGDAISVFHAVAGSKDKDDYGSNDPFTYTSTSKNSFSGTLSTALENGKSYDWYAIYNYYEGYTTPAASSDADGGAIYIGYRPGITQSGLNSTAHLKGSSCTMYGVAKNIAADQPVVVDMKHLTSVVKINVNNTSGADLTVNSIEFTAEKDIVGSYYIDITGDSPVYVAKSGSVSNVATLNATGKTTIADGASGAFYIPIKPFTAASGDKLTISVNGRSKEKNLTKDVTFVAGKIHAVTFDFNYPVILPSSTSVDVEKEGGDKSFTYTITNRIAGKSLNAVASDTWIKNIDLSTDGTVSFKVDKNTGGARTGKITLSYELADDIVVSVNQSGDAPIPAIGTIMWQETWEGGTKDETPALYGQEGTTVYNDGTVIYSSSNSDTKLYEDTLDTMNLLLKGNDTWIISGIPTGGATKFTLTFITNNKTSTRYKLSSETDGVSVGSTSYSGSTSPFTITAEITISKSIGTFDLSIANTTKSNVRLDDLKIVVSK